MHEIWIIQLMTTSSMKKKNRFVYNVISRHINTIVSYFLLVRKSMSHLTEISTAQRKA